MNIYIHTIVELDVSHWNTIKPHWNIIQPLNQNSTQCFATLLTWNPIIPPSFPHHSASRPPTSSWSANLRCFRERKPATISDPSVPLVTPTINDLSPSHKGWTSQSWGIPSGNLTVCELENGPVEIVDLPSYKMVDLSIVMLVYQRV